jgi:DsbC/DsbD-like thiol-disulfide interchange protein
MPAIMRGRSRRHERASRRAALAVALMTMAAMTTGVHAAKVKPGNTEAELVAERVAVVPGQRFTVALRLRMNEHWHTYWKNPGDAGMPTNIKWQLPPGFEAGPIQWPAPQRIPVGRMVSYGYEGEVLLLVDIVAPRKLAAGGDVKLAARANWLECKEVCIPQQANLTLSLPVAKNADVGASPVAARFEDMRQVIPKEIKGWNVLARREGEAIVVDLVPRQHVAKPFGAFYFFSEREGVVEPAGVQRVKKEGATYRLTMPVASHATGDFSELRGVLFADEPWPGNVGRAVAFAVPLK